MSIAKPEQSALGLPKSGYGRVITKILVSAAIAVGSCVGVAAPASAEEDAFGADPNPFSGFSCSCQETAPPDGPARTEELNRGIRAGFSAWLPVLSAPSQLR
jgi:hypothetical protein